MKIWFLTFLLIMSLPICVQANEEGMADSVQEDRAISLGKELRCVVCQSESINDSQSDMARDMRLLVREKIKNGWSDQKILDFARERYGDFILLRPPVQRNTYILWALPIFFFVVAAFLGLKLVHRKNQQLSGTRHL